MRAHAVAFSSRVVLALWLAALTGLPLQAQRFAPTTTAEAAVAARAVVAAKVLAVDVRSEGWIYTYIDFQTTEILKGAAPQRFTYRMTGGRVGDTQTVTGMPPPRFTPGEEVVLLLGTQTSADGNPTVHLEHVYRVTTSPSGARIISPSPTGLNLAAAPQAAAAASPGGARFDDFVSALKKLK